MFIKFHKREAVKQQKWLSGLLSDKDFIRENKLTSEKIDAIRKNFKHIYKISEDGTLRRKATVQSI